jgi:hypothetical protein
MTKTIALLFVVPLGLFAGCGSSSSPAGSAGDGGSGGGSDATTPSPDAGPNPLGSPQAGTCPAMPCPTGQQCCINPLSMTGMCLGSDASCGGITLQCMMPTDCTGNKVCCGMMGGRSFSLSCVASDQCVGSGTFQLCDSTHSCPSGESCMSSMFGGGSFCVSPDAGASDASASDGGPGDAGASG